MYQLTNPTPTVTTSACLKTLPYVPCGAKLSLVQSTGYVECHILCLETGEETVSQFCDENEAGSGHTWYDWLCEEGTSGIKGGECHSCYPHSPPRGSWSCHTVIRGTVFLSVLVHNWVKLEKKLNHLQLHHKREYKNSIKHWNVSWSSIAGRDLSKEGQHTGTAGTVCRSRGWRGEAGSPAYAGGHQTWALGHTHSPLVSGPNPDAVILFILLNMKSIWFWFLLCDPSSPCGFRARNHAKKLWSWCSGASRKLGFSGVHWDNCVVPIEF